MDWMNVTVAAFYEHSFELCNVCLLCYCADNSGFVSAINEHKSGIAPSL